MRRRKDCDSRREPQYIMRRKSDGLYFREIDHETGGDTMTKDPREARCFNHNRPFGFAHDWSRWEVIDTSTLAASE